MKQDKLPLPADKMQVEEETGNNIAACLCMLHQVI